MFARLASLTVLVSVFLAAKANLLPFLPFPFDLPPFIGTSGPYWIFGPQHQSKTLQQTVAFACFGGGGNCECPIDKNKDSGVLINVFPGYQCAYPNGACTWDDVTGALQNTNQGNCPSSAPCTSAGGCDCPVDLNNSTGVLINQFTGYQCAYPKGACTWDGTGALQNTQQTNCVTSAKCQQPGKDS
ncbi:hypothetical protein PHLCEN_2v5516 [Hermanssonia centrifuga]|uniref:Uncharacterized protein n=1 Tax=Hermanssonia centrifuga TaxID=98765 RepID=A0A2R6P2B7_9APHY|nr:hypothetical protein PHLCEN_2v5516 [Hermanssonia centrifuga]